MPDRLVHECYTYGVRLVRVRVTGCCSCLYKHFNIHIHTPLAATAVCRDERERARSRESTHARERDGSRRAWARIRRERRGPGASEEGAIPIGGVMYRVTHAYSTPSLFTDKCPLALPALSRLSPDHLARPPRRSLAARRPSRRPSCPRRPQRSPCRSSLRGQMQGGEIGDCGGGWLEQPRAWRGAQSHPNPNPNPP